eukprot:3781294-Prymnesium_polylepis.1
MVTDTSRHTTCPRHEPDDTRRHAEAARGGHRCAGAQRGAPRARVESRDRVPVALRRAARKRRGEQSRGIVTKYREVAGAFARHVRQRRAACRVPRPTTTSDHPRGNPRIS